MSTLDVLPNRMVAGDTADTAYPASAREMIRSHGPSVVRRTGQLAGVTIGHVIPLRALRVTDIWLWEMSG